MPASEQGHVKRTEDKYADRFQAARKEATARDPEKIEAQRLVAIRKYEYDTRRKRWRRRFEHMKAMCVIIMLSYGEFELVDIPRRPMKLTCGMWSSVNQKLALAGLALLIWRVVNSELARLMDKEPGAGMHEEYSARFGTHAMARQRPAGAKNTMAEVNSLRAPNRLGAATYFVCAYPAHRHRVVPTWEWAIFSNQVGDMSECS